MLELSDDAVHYPVPDHVPAELVYPFEQIYAKGFDIDPWTVFRQVQAEAPPIFYSPTCRRGSGIWYVTTSEDVRTVFQDHSRFTTSMNYSAGMQMARRMLPLELDPPDHNKYRSLLTPLFAPKSIDRLEASIRATCDALLDAIIDRGECDFVTDFARTLPGTVFMELMGLPMDRRDEFFAWEETFFHGGTAEERAATGKAIEAALADLVEQRRAAPREDLVSMLVHGRFEDGTPIPTDDVMDMCWLLFLAGLDTVHAGLGHAFRYLAEHPEKRRELVADPSLVPAAVEELLRWHSWVNPARTVRVDCELNGVVMKRGEKIGTLAVLADRDPSAYESPEDVDLHRNKVPHWAFGGGPHRCVGSHLARRELGIAISAWIERIPDFEIPPDQVGTLRYATAGMFSLQRLPLSWSATPS
ncbi:MAG: cytochrome P450 [Acidimicrobiia bacterium]